MKLMRASLFFKDLEKRLLIMVTDIFEAKKRGGLREQGTTPNAQSGLGRPNCKSRLEGGSRGERIRCAQYNRHWFGVFVAIKVSAFVKTG